MKFKIKVEFHPDPFEYEVEVEESSEERAEETAARLLDHNLLDQLLEPIPYGWGGRFSFEVEQLTGECDECGMELPVADLRDELCAPCYAKAEAEEKAYWLEKKGIPA